MNPTTKKVYQKLYQQAVEVKAIFELILSLFGNSKNIDLIIRTKPWVFLHFHNALLDAVILKLAKITDSAKTGKFTNLSIDHLIKSLEGEGSSIVSQLENSREKINSFLQELREIRNKRVAHNDLEAHFEGLPKIINNGDIDGAIKELEKFFNIISFYYQCAESELKFIYPHGDGPEVFMKYFRIGENAYRRKMPE